MNDVMFLVSLFLGGAIAIYSLWLICNYNGKIVLYYFLTLYRLKIKAKNQKSPDPFDDGISMAAVCLIGLMPLALLSLGTAATNQCFNSVQATVLLELAFTVSYGFIPAAVKKQFDLFGIELVKQQSRAIAYGLLWCLSFAVWATLNHHANLDYMISNTNPDMWAYVRRIAAFTTDKLSFYGGSDSFTFRDNSACAYLVGSPKKFSSFLGSLISYPFRGSSLGIAVFQNALGGILLISLFREWMDVQLPKVQGIPLEGSLLLAWVLSSPPLYWLLVSAYFSNALFVIITALTLREARRVALAGRVDTPESLFFFFSVLAIVFSFYPAFTPIIILVYLGTLLVYIPDRNSAATFRMMLKFVSVVIGCGIFFGLVFPSQLGLYEVRKSLDFTREHGSNFVPLNPWSLLQEKPKPMGSTKDFGVYANIIIGLLFSGGLGWRLLSRYRHRPSRDLIAGLVGLGIYSSYLLAHIPLESTYRLMKIAVSIIYPLAIFGFLPLLLWGRRQWVSQSAWRYGIVVVLAVFHVVLHVHKTLDIRSFPSGNFTMVSRLEDIQGTEVQGTGIQSINVVGCEEVHQSQFYERLVGLQLARRYPDVIVNVFRSPEHLEASLEADFVLYGEVVAGETEKQNTCHFAV